MKFCAENNIEIFSFHDSEFAFESFDGKNLVVTASMLNIQKNTHWNPSDYDMEIDIAQITFRNFSLSTYDAGDAWETGEDGKLYPSGAHVVYTGQDGMDRILEELKHGITVLYFAKKDHGYSMGCVGMDPYFEIGFDFGSISICWDEYKQKAWYELQRHYQYAVVLRTPEGDETVKLVVGCNEEPESYNGSLAINVGCRLQNKDYWGEGSDCLWIDAFASLQKQLPEGVQLTCCLTCRHGNLCPVGSAENEVFCTKDVVITQKSDLYFYTEDDVERAKRVRQYCDLCDDYHPQTDDFYTYNDYLCFLQKG